MSDHKCTGALRLICGDQLSMQLASLKGADKAQDVLLMAEVWDEANYVPHHKKKIAFLFAAMRHHAAALKADGWHVQYVRLDDAGNTGSFLGEVQRTLAQHPKLGAVHVTCPGEWRVYNDMCNWQAVLSRPVVMHEDDRFLCSRAQFASWAKGRADVRMEFFYREMRKQHRILMTDDGKPIGGQWNFDAENRKKLPKGVRIPPEARYAPDPITQDVLALVAARFDNHFGDLEPFHFAVTRAQALATLDHFIDTRLAQFGDYQDAMKQGEPWLFHSHLSFYINCGLLDPAEVIAKVEAAYKAGQAPLNAVEGYIRQILGWREFVRGIYWLKMPDYAQSNALNATRALPDLYWSANTDMNCMRQCVTETRQNAYAHHIQRLMVTGNFALLAGIDPKYVNEWYLAVYADAFEWVELPNVTGMILFADGGYLASKPYAAGGAYINRMSDYCGQCRYDVAEKTGPKACPFNYLYWDFVMRHDALLRSNARMGMMYATLDKMPEAQKNAVKASATAFLDSL